MLTHSKPYRFFKVIIPVLLASSLLLAACGGGATVDAGADLDVQAEAQAEEDAEMEAEADASAEMEAEADAESGDDMAEESSDGDAAAEADVEAEAEAEANAGAYPELVLGDAAFHETDPATVTLASGEVQFVEFFAYWCTVCKAIAPTVHGLEDIYGERVNFVYLDRDNPATADLQSQLGYVYQPHIFILDEDGNVLFESLSYVEGTVLQEAIENALQ